jgi:hypothetical protein
VADDYRQGNDARSNIPIPDPSDKTVEAIRVAVNATRELIHAEQGGIQAVINERLNSIDKRLDTGMIEVRASAAVALAGVVEAGKDQVIKFETLERRVAALELTLSQTGGKDIGSTRFGSAISQALAGLAAVAAMLAAAFAWHNGVWH